MRGHHSKAKLLLPPCLPLALAPCPPLALISCLLGLLQLLQGRSKAFLGTVQLFLYQLNAAVQGGYIGLSLWARGQRSERLCLA